MLPQTTEKPFAAIFLENFRKTAKTVDSVGLALVAIWYDECASRVQLPVKEHGWRLKFIFWIDFSKCK